MTPKEAKPKESTKQGSCGNRCCGEPHGSELSSLSLGMAGPCEDITFTSLTILLNKNTLKTIEEMGFKDMMEIQHKSIRLLLEGRDLWAVAKLMLSPSL